MKKNILIVFLSLLFIFFRCSTNTEPVINEDDTSNLRIINLAIYPPGQMAVYLNDQVFIDSLYINHNSEYLSTKDDSVKLEVYDSNVMTSSIYDTLLFLSKDKYYTLILYKNNERVCSYFIEDVKYSSEENTAVRIFNNSQDGKPFIFSLCSIKDTVSFIDPSLFMMSSYKILEDTSYIPVLKLISNGISGYYDRITLEKNNHYTIIITDTGYHFDYYYPYFFLLFADKIEDK